MEARRGIPEEADEEVGWEEAMRFLLSQTKAKVTQKKQPNNYLLPNRR